MRINNNLMAMNTHRQMGATATNQAKSMEKLSSGLRINRAGDDAAGLAISEKMRGQIRGLSQASRNAQDGISLIQTAEGALNEVSDMLTRIKELYVQDANGTYSGDDKTNISNEIAELTKEIDNIKTKTKFNDTALLDGTLDIKIQTGDKTGDELPVKQAAITTTATTLAETETAISNVSTARAGLGALQNRLEHTVSNINTTSENLQAAESRIRDVDMAKEMMNFTKNNILAQASQSMLAQANQAPQAVLKLLG